MISFWNLTHNVLKAWFKGNLESHNNNHMYFYITVTLKHLPIEKRYITRILDEKSYRF